MQTEKVSVLGVGAGSQRPEVYDRSGFPHVQQVCFDRRMVLRLASTLATVTVSPKYQVVIPSEVRNRLKLRPGQKVAVIEKDGVVHLVPIRPLKELKGMAAGTTSKGLRDEGKDR